MEGAGCQTAAGEHPNGQGQSCWTSSLSPSGWSRGASQDSNSGDCLSLLPHSQVSLPACLSGATLVSGAAGESQSRRRKSSEPLPAFLCRGGESCSPTDCFQGRSGRPCVQCGFANSQEVFPEQNPPKQNSFARSHFPPCLCPPELKQVCCCFYNLGEEIEPFAAETSGAKPSHATDTRSWFPDQPA